MYVEKTPALLSLSKSELELSDFKLLDLYLGRIDSHDIEHNVVVLEKGAIENALGVDRIRKEDLKKRLIHLMQPVAIDDDDDGCKLIPLFDCAIMQRDDAGTWTVLMQCTHSAAKYIFTKDALRYLPYYIRDIINLQSRYSYVLYLYLKDNRFRRSWEIDIEELKNVMRVRGASYAQFKEFNKKILKLCQNEINSKTSINFDYEPSCRRGRKFTKVKFTIIKDISGDTPLLTEPVVVSEISALSQVEVPADETEKHKYWAEVFNGNEILAALCEVTKYEFSKKEIEYIAAILQRVPIGDRKQLLNEVYCNMSRYEIGVKNRVNYLSEALKKEIAKRNREEMEGTLDLGDSSFSIDEWYNQADGYDPEKIVFKED
jgi:hypothetical protein